jgi:hypothetical protein
MTSIKAVCSLCNGRSWTREIIGSEVENFRCLCFKARLLNSYLGPELAKAPHRHSELYNLQIDPETNEEVGDRTLDDLFIKGEWSEVAQHIRWAVGVKHIADPKFSFRIVTDHLLLRVFVGDFAYRNRSQQVRDDIETFNGITDLVSPSSLLIIRLGNMAHPNKAAANVLREVLNIRATESKATWLIEGHTYFGEGHTFYNYDVGNYVEENFEQINVGGDIEAARKLEAELRASGDESAALDETESDPAPVEMQTCERFKAAPKDWERKKRGPSKWGKKRGGGLMEAL